MKQKVKIGNTIQMISHVQNGGTAIHRGWAVYVDEDGVPTCPNEIKMKNGRIMSGSFEFDIEMYNENEDWYLV